MLADGAPAEVRRTAAGRAWLRVLLGPAEEVAVALYGRDDLAWDELARAGLEFLVERARLENSRRIPSSMPL